MGTGEHGGHEDRAQVTSVGMKTGHRRARGHQDRAQVGVGISSDRRQVSKLTVLSLTSKDPPVTERSETTTWHV